MAQLTIQILLHTKNGRRYNTMQVRMEFVLISNQKVENVDRETKNGYEKKWAWSVSVGPGWCFTMPLPSGT
jgi:hypothetical protein